MRDGKHYDCDSLAGVDNRRDLPFFRNQNTLMTAQEIFNKVTAHLRKQKISAVSASGGACQYRAGALSCAVGCLIPEAVYDPIMEGSSIEIDGDWTAGDDEGSL